MRSFVCAFRCRPRKGVVTDMKKSFIIVLALAVMFLGFGTLHAVAAPRAIEVDYDEYSLWVDEVPEGIWESTYIAAKLKKTSLDPEQYILTMIDDADSLNKLHKAMNSAKMAPENNRSFAMDVRLYEYDDDEEDYYASTDSDVDVIVPVSDNMFQYDEEDEPYLQTNFLKVVSVSSSGKLSYPSFELISVDEIICAKFTVTDNGVYGFVLNGVAPESEDDEEEEPVPTKAPTATPTKAPTKAPTATPTKAPTKTPTKAPTKTPTKVPTKAPAATTAPKPSQAEPPVQNITEEKDKTPQTGDDHNSGLLLLLGSISAITLGTVIVAWKREEKEEA